jgi:hypothetical protein
VRREGGGEGWGFYQSKHTSKQVPPPFISKAQRSHPTKRVSQSTSDQMEMEDASDQQRPGTEDPTPGLAGYSSGLVLHDLSR